MTENATSSENKQNRPFFVPCVICETVLVIIILLTMLSLKFFAPKTFKDCKKWYVKYLLDDTKISEVIESDEV